MSGPKQSIYGPIKPFFASSMVYRLVILSNSFYEYFFGSIAIPPLAPPKGTSAIVSLKVIREAKAMHS